MKKILVWVMVLAMALGLTACGEKEETAPPKENKEDTAKQDAAADSESKDDSAKQQDGDKTYFINPKNIGPAYWAAAEKGALKAGEELGVEVIFNAPSDADSAKQISMINDMLARDIDGLAISPNDANAISQVIQSAIDKGVKVITWDSDAADSNRAYFVAAETQERLGETYVEQMAQQIDGKGKIVFMVASLGAQNMITQVDAAKAYLEKNYPDIEVLEVYASNDEQQKAYENAQNILATYKDLDGIVSFAGAESPAAAEAISEAVDNGQIEPGQVALTGFGMPSLVKQYVESGIIERFCVWDPGVLGYASVYVLDEMTKGTDISTLTEIPGVGEIRVEDQNVYTGVIEVTKDNIGDYDF